MKKMKLIVLSTALMFGISTVSQAAFPVSSTETTTNEVTNNPTTTTTTSSNVVTKTESKVKQKKLTKLQKKVIKKAQKKINKSAKDGSSISKGLYVLLSIIGFGWLAMGILSDWSGSDWIISLVLYIILWLPGLIYSLIKMKNYY